MEYIHIYRNIYEKLINKLVIETQEQKKKTNVLLFFDIITFFFFFIYTINIISLKTEKKTPLKSTK